MSFYGLTYQDTAIPPFSPEIGLFWLNWPCPVGSALKKTLVQDSNSFPILLLKKHGMKIVSKRNVFCSDENNPSFCEKLGNQIRFCPIQVLT